LDVAIAQNVLPLHRRFSMLLLEL